MARILAAATLAALAGSCASAPKPLSVTIKRQQLLGPASGTFLTGPERAVDLTIRNEGFDPFEVFVGTGGDAPVRYSVPPKKSMSYKGPCTGFTVVVDSNKLGIFSGSAFYP